MKLARERQLVRGLDVAKLSLGIFKSFFSSPLALGLVLFSFLILGLILSSWATLGWFLLGALICTVPGWFACKLLYGVEFARSWISFGHTLILGLLITTFLSVLLAALGLGLAVPTMLVAALSGALLFFLLGRWMRTPVSDFQDDNPAATKLAISVGLFLVLVIVAGPLFNVGQWVDDSYTYAPYFNRDFFRNVAFGAQLSKGVIPPDNPYVQGEILHYYWFQMIFPALVYRLSGMSVSLEQVSLLSTLFVNIAFVFVFVHLLRRFVAGVFALILVLGLAFVAESYQAPFKLILLLQPTHWALEGTWLGALSLPPLGYLFQALLYLPHHLAALVALLIVVPLLSEPAPQGKVVRAISAALILVLAGGFSFFIIAFGFLWAGTYLALQFLKEVYAVLKSGPYESAKSALVATTLSGVIVGVAGLITYSLLIGLGMLPGDSNGWKIYVSVYHLVVPIRLLIMLGPMFVLGLAGLVVVWRGDKKLRSRSAGLVWLMVSTLLMVVFLIPTDLPEWEVSQKLGMVLRMPVLVLAGVFIDRLLHHPIGQKKGVQVALILFCASAVPNLLGYEYVHLKLHDSNLLTYVSASERTAADWIRQHTPLNAVVQTWPGGQTSIKPYQRGGGDAFSLIPVFAERQTAIGDPQFSRYYIARSKYPDVETRTAEIEKIYTKPDQSNVANILEKFHIDYVYWGVSERRCCSESLSWYEQTPLFEEVYNQDGVSVFRFVGQ